MAFVSNSLVSPRGFVFALLAAALLVSTSVRAGEAADDPAAAAATYEKQAADLRASADKHEKLAKMHKTGSAGSDKVSHASIAQHCQSLAENLRAAAKESDAIAEAYRKLAAQ